MKAMLEVVLVDKEVGIWDLVLTVDDGSGSQTTYGRSEGRRSGAIAMAVPMLDKAKVDPADAFKMVNKLTYELGQGAESTKVANFELERTAPTKLNLHARRQVTKGRNDGWKVTLSYDSAVRETWTAGNRKDAIAEASRMLTEAGVGPEDVREILRKLALNLAGKDAAQVNWRKE